MNDPARIKPPYRPTFLPERRNAMIGKLGEECSELAAKCFRAMIQGLDELDPDTGRTNISQLQDEIADVAAQITLAQQYLALDSHQLKDRARRKVAFKRPWIEALPDERSAGRKAADPYEPCDYCGEEHPVAVLEDGLCPACCDDEGNLPR